VKAFIGVDLAEAVAASRTRRPADCAPVEAETMVLYKETMVLYK
jgi:hypothetical protein